MLRTSLVTAGLVAGVALPAHAAARPFTDYFKPTPFACPTTSSTWGDKAVLPRDTCNGLEDPTGTPTVKPKWMYWDGKILRAADGKYHMFADRWPHANGMGDWVNSETIHATSTALLGPYVDQGYAFNDGPDTGKPHKGHNVTASELPDGTYCLIVNEIVPFTIFTASSLDGPWKNRGHAQIDTNGVQVSIPMPGDQHLESNVSFVVRHDGTFEIIQRHGIIAISNTLMGPYKVQKPTTTYPAAQVPPSNLATIFPNRPKHLSTASGAPQNPESVYVYAEDPIIWYSGGQYHVIYNYPDDRVAYHLTSVDGIHDWTDQGLAFDPREGQKIFTNEDGSVTRWYNVERPNVIMENGHVAYFTFAVSDVFKMNISGSSNSATKVIAVAFDGVKFDQETGVGGLDAGIGGSDGGGGTGGGGGRPGTDGGAGGTSGRDAGALGSGGSTGSGSGGAGGTSAPSGSGGTSVPRSGSGGAVGSGGSTGAPASGGRGGLGGSAGATTIAASGGAQTGGNQAVGGIGGTGGGTGGHTSGGSSTAGGDSGGCGCTLAKAKTDQRSWCWSLAALCTFLLMQRTRRAPRPSKEDPAR
jgi:hypothetical protein